VGGGGGKGGKGGFRGAFMKQRAKTLRRLEEFRKSKLS